MTESATAYGFWSLAIANAAIYILFALTFFRPRTSRDWRSFGAFSGFVVALFAEMYGFPLTIYLLSGWLQSRFPRVDWFSHDVGHPLEMLIGWKADPHFGPFYLLSFALIASGFVLTFAAWQVLHAARQRHMLATTGAYAYVRHPQYVGLVLVMLGFLLQWPTLLTFPMFLALAWIYLRLAREEEREALAAFGDVYRTYMRRVPAFVPRAAADGV